MEKVGHFLDKVIAYLGHVGVVAGIISVIVMTLMITVDVVLRYLFNRPLAFGTEYSGYLLVFISYVALGYVARVGGHINVDFLVRRLPRQQRNGVDIIGLFVTLGLISLYLWFAWDLWLGAVQSGQESETIMRTPLWIPYTFLWVGLLLLDLELVVLIFKRLREFFKG